MLVCMQNPCVLQQEVSYNEVAALAKQPNSNYYRYLSKTSKLQLSAYLDRVHSKGIAELKTNAHPFLIKKKQPYSIKLPALAAC